MGSPTPRRMQAQRGALGYHAEEHDEITADMAAAVTHAVCARRGCVPVEPTPPSDERDASEQPHTYNRYLGPVKNGRIVCWCMKPKGDPVHSVEPTPPSEALAVEQPEPPSEWPEVPYAAPLPGGRRPRPVEQPQERTDAEDDLRHPEDTIVNWLVDNFDEVDANHAPGLLAALSAEGWEVVRRVD